MVINVFIPRNPNLIEKYFAKIKTKYNLSEQHFKEMTERNSDLKCSGTRIEVGPKTKCTPFIGSQTQFKAMYEARGTVLILTLKEIEKLQ